MKSAVRFQAQVPEAYQKQGIRWLVLEEEVEGGWFLFMLEDLSGPPTFDSYCLLRNQAEQQAASEWGVSTADWKICEET